LKARAFLRVRQMNSLDYESLKGAHSFCFIFGALQQFLDGDDRDNDLSSLESRQERLGWTSFTSRGFAVDRDQI